MARKPTDKQLFKMKNEWLGQFYEEMRLDESRTCVFWNESIDLSSDTIYEYGAPM